MTSLSTAAKTIFITVYDGLISKNILRSDAFRKLHARPDIRIVLFVQENKVEYYAREFADDRVDVHATPAATHPKLEALLFFCVNYSTRTPGALYRLRERSVWKRPLMGLAVRTLYALGRFRWWHALLRFLYERLPDASHDAYLATYNPDAFFAANMISSQDARLMKLGKQRGIPVVGMIKSWDNVGNKGFPFIHVDRLIVTNEIVKEEAEQILGIDPAIIRVVGFPQFDLYIDRTHLESREAFFRRIGADPAKRLILYAATGYEWTPYEVEVLEMLDDAIAEGKVREPVQVLVRFHPKYQNPEARLDTRAHLICERPGTYVTNSLQGWEYERADTIHLMNTLHHSDICINTGSTMAIESMVFDKPTIGIAFDGRHTVPFHLSVKRFYTFLHNKKLVELEGEDVAKTPDELVAAINRYLADPSYRAQGRERTRDRECYKLDGKAGQRISEVVLDVLGIAQ